MSRQARKKEWGPSLPPPADFARWKLDTIKEMIADSVRVNGSECGPVRFETPEGFREVRVAHPVDAASVFGSYFFTFQRKRDGTYFTRVVWEVAKTLDIHQAQG